MKKTAYLLIFLLALGLNQTLLAQKVTTAGSGTQTATDAKHYKYETVPGDPLNARIYTLDNGLKVYMTVYKDAPRIQTYIAVGVGSKNDPKETTGLAHYFEHMMFKGTPDFGTSNWEMEKPLIAKVDSLFEIYRTLTDENQRTAMYKMIDSISFAASKYAIPNEYDKLMTAIGAEGTNAYTSVEQTVYVENIPSNQLDNWALIESDRFANPVLRGFHTELETIYEEKNMTLTSDPRKVFTALLEGLFQNHPYGTQTTIGTQEHIKNPSMKNIREFHANYYVPNNMAIALSGDFDPDEAIKIVDKYFGTLKPVEVPKFAFTPEKPITEPVTKTVYGPDAANMMLAFRLNGAGSDDALKLQLLDMILSNSAAGLIDLNLVKKQKVLKAGSGSYILKDYSALFLYGTPKEGQTLDEVRDLLLAQLELIKKGEFSDDLLPAIINDLKLKEIKSYEDNDSRAGAFVDAFILGISWKDYISQIDRMAKFTKKDIVDFANANFSNNYAIVYKETGKDTTIKKISKNKLTKLDMNRDMESDFLKKIKDSKVQDIEPVYVDFDKSITKATLKSNIPLLYVQNTENELFSMYYVFDMGSSNMKKLPYAIDYLKFVGTDKMSSEELSKKFYSLGCEFNVFNSDDQVYVKLSGLGDNFTAGLELFENLLANAQPNEETWKNYVSDELKSRDDAKKNLQMVFGYLISYGIYGEINPMTSVLSEKELQAMTANEAVDIIKSLLSYDHRVLFYGNISSDKLAQILNEKHQVPATLKKVPTAKVFEQQPTKENMIYYVNFDTPQSQILMLSQGEKGFNTTLNPTVRLFNDYFGGSMNSVIFQEMREARSLAYTAISFYQSPDKKDDHYYSLSYIATQYDKMETAIDVFLELLSKMPESDNAFNLAKDGLIKQIRTARTTRDDVLWKYEDYKKLGVTQDLNKDVFEKVPGMTLGDLKKFQDSYLKDRNHTFLIIGDEKQLPLKMLKKYGKVQEVKMETIFGY
ncbi:MAG: peptidase M16 [Bacteroidetes bacterium HGW-Bacteroidetes-6]|jgi:predicted Zn-dependent peptidase|nr:MAG: peptidase M16 [Bacteroidetes bacterium HGW-Bacteroidetes-6]